MQGIYERTYDVCGKPSWSKKTRYNGVFYENQRIWWHGGKECGQRVSKGFAGYWKIGTFWDDNFSLGAMDTLDANPSVEAKIQQTKIVVTQKFSSLFNIAVQIVEFLSGGYKIRKIFA